MSQKTASSLLQAFFALVTALLYYAWRAMRGRPAFIHQSDSPLTQGLFAALYVTTTVVVSLSLEFSAQSFWGALIRAATHFFIVKTVLHVLLNSPKTHLSNSGLPLANTCAAISAWQMLLLLPYLLIWIVISDVAAQTFVVAGSLIALFYAPYAIAKSFNALPEEFKRPGYKPSPNESTNQ